MTKLISKHINIILFDVYQSFQFFQSKLSNIVKNSSPAYLFPFFEEENHLNKSKMGSIVKVLAILVIFSLTRAHTIPSDTEGEQQILISIFDNDF